MQNGDVSLLVDPDNNRLKADVVLRTLSPADVNPATAESGEISFPGEYEVKDIEISGLELPEESGEKFLKTIYIVKWDDIKLVLLGHLSKTVSPEIMEQLEEPDVLFIPAGGGSTPLTAGGHFLSGEAAAKLIKQIEPSVVLPTFAKNAGDLLKAMGQKSAPEEKFVFKKKDIENEKNKVIVLEPKT